MRSMIPVLAIGAMIGLSGPAFALDIVNEDNTPYEIYLSGNAVQGTMTLDAGETAKNVCRDDICTMEFGDGAGHWGSFENEVVVIKNGRMTVQPHG